MEEIKSCMLCNRWFLSEHVEEVRMGMQTVTVCKECLKVLREGKGLHRQKAEA